MDRLDTTTDCTDCEKRIRVEAERDFQNSDYWNDYLSKVISDTRADVIDEICGKYFVCDDYGNRIDEEWLKEQK